MTGALIILAVMIAVGLLLYFSDGIISRHGHHASRNRAGESVPSHNEETEKTATSSASFPSKAEEVPEVCCGLHLVCEKNSLSPMSDEIIYYEDEELDRFRERGKESYTPEETEEFRDILLTMLPEDVAGWSRSLQLRKIELPDEIREELLMIVADARAKEAG